MTDKELIKQEIERIIEEETPISKGSDYYHGTKESMEKLLQFINSLPEEPVSEDLDFIVISLEETIGTSPHSREVIKKHLQRAAEWQKQQMKETLQTEYEKCRFDMREEMMKDAVELTITNTSFIPLPKLDIKAGDKVKIVVLKTE